MVKEDAFTEDIQCGHCRNIAPMKIGATYSHKVDSQSVGSDWEDEADQELDIYKVYELCVCRVCKEVTVRFHYWHEFVDNGEIATTVLYPAKEVAVNGLPLKIQQAYDEAQSVRNVSTNAYGVMLGRVLELVCQDRGATGSTLGKKLSSLVQKNEIPEKIFGIATGLRKLRNLGAHAGLGELTARELPVLDDLTRAVLEYVYSASYLAELAESKLLKLQNVKNSDSSRNPTPAELP